MGSRSGYTKTQATRTYTHKTIMGGHCLADRTCSSKTCMQQQRSRYNSHRHNGQRAVPNNCVRASASYMRRMTCIQPKQPPTITQQRQRDREEAVVCIVCTCSACLFGPRNDIETSYLTDSDSVISTQRAKVTNTQTSNTDFVPRISRALHLSSFWHSFGTQAHVQLVSFTEIRR